MKRVLPHEEGENRGELPSLWRLGPSCPPAPDHRSPIYHGGVTRTFSLFVLTHGLYAIPGISLLFFPGYWLGDQFRI